MRRNSKKLDFFLVFLFVSLMSLSFLKSPGTTDVEFWTRWMESADSHGIIDGYESIIKFGYPPLSFAILGGLSILAKSVAISHFMAIKCVNFFFLLISVVMFMKWKKSPVFALLMFFVGFLNAMGLGYIDVFYMPFLIGSLWALSSNRRALAGVLYVLALMIKWQPLIIAPFFLFYFWRGNKKDFVKNILPAFILFLFIVFLFGPVSILKAFDDGAYHEYHEYLSGNALNLHWIVTWVIEKDGMYGHRLHDGMVHYIGSGPSSIYYLLFKIITLVFILPLIVAFWFSDRDFSKLLIYSMTGFVTYFTLNVSVHENHLFVASILAAILISLDKGFKVPALLIICFDSLNLLLFYGINGKLGFNRAFGFDPSVLLAIFMVLFWAIIYIQVMFYTWAQFNQRKASKK